MRKPVLIGGGLGLLVLALVAGSVWWAGNRAPSGVTAANKAAHSDRATVPGVALNPVQPALGSSASQPRSSQASQERRRRLAELRAEFNALRAKGVDAPPERMRAVVDELEALSPPGFDPRYYQTLRNMLDVNTRVQALSKELQALSKSAAPKDADRRQAILDEMRVLGERVTAEARNLQAYAPKPQAVGNAP